MIKLNKTQLIIAWIVSILISIFVMLPAINITGYYSYESFAGHRLPDVTFRQKEMRDKFGRFYVDKDSGKKYYYKGADYKYSLNKSQYPYERIALIIFLNGIMLIYTLRPSKQ